MRPSLKKLFALALASLAAALLAGRPAAAAQPFQTSVPSAILIDADIGSGLVREERRRARVPASTIKVMTAELVFRALAQGRMKLDDTFTVSEHAWRTGGALARGSTMFAALNSNIRVEDLIRGLVIVSGNDAAIVLAEGLAGSEGAFATRMTERAPRTRFHAFRSSPTPGGRDDPDQSVTAARDGELAALCHQNLPAILSLFRREGLSPGTRSSKPTAIRLLTMDIGADGLKTGNIDAQRLWPRRLGRPERPAAHPRDLRRRERQGARGGSAQALPMGVSCLRFEDDSFSRWRGRRLGQVYGGSSAPMPLVATRRCADSYSAQRRRQVHGPHRL